MSDITSEKTPRMSDETRMIIITSDDDLIRQLSKSQWQKTRLIDLDEHQPPSNGNLNDWNVFAELSQVNQTTDQVYQRILSAPVIHRRKGTRKSSNSSCAICGDKAIGYNYDVLSCASCKAFFRRNAQHSIEKLRCLTGQQKCCVDHSTTRKCQRCRLERCFQQGMRKDFIVSEAEKQQKQQRLEENRQQQVTSVEPAQLQQSEELSIEDWLDIEKIKSSYAMFFDDDSLLSNHMQDVHDRRSAIASWSESADRTGMKLIQFFRQLDQFEALNSDDRFFLVKFNLFSISLVYKTKSFNWRTGTFVNITPEEQKKHNEYFCTPDGQPSAKEGFYQMLKSFSAIIQGDSTLLYLLLIVLLFTNDLPADPKRGSLIDPLAVHRCQSYFTQLMTNYLRQKHGEEGGNRLLAALFLELGRLPSVAEKMQQFFRSQIESNELLQSITPLMQTVLNLN